MTTFKLDPEIARTAGDIVIGDASERSIDTILLGRLAEAGPRREVWLDVSGEQVVAILGKRGTGKSYTLGVIIEGLAAGLGTSNIASLSTSRAGLVFDIMDIFWTTQLPLMEQGPPELSKQHSIMEKGGFKTRELAIDVWIPDGFQDSDIDPPNINLLRIAAYDLEIDDWGSLFEVDIYSEPRGMLIADAIAHVGSSGYLDSNGQQYAPNPRFSFDDLMRCLDADVDIQANYRPDTIRSVRQRLRTYADLPLFSGVGTPLSELLQSARVSVLMLARVPDALKKVLVAVLTRRILRDRRDASMAKKRLDLDSRLQPDERQELESLILTKVPRTWLAMDEAHILGSGDESSVAKEALIKYAKEGRNYGLSLALATQQPSALDPRLMSQVETAVIHQLTDHRDAAVARNVVRSPLPLAASVDGESADMTTVFRRLGQGVATLSSGNAPNLPRVCIVSIRPRISAHGGYEA